MIEVDGVEVAALAEGDAQESEIEQDKNTNAGNDDPAMESAIRDAQKEERHAKFEEALVDEVRCNAQDTQLCFVESDEWRRTPKGTQNTYPS